MDGGRLDDNMSLARAVCIADETKKWKGPISITESQEASASHLSGYAPVCGNVWPECVCEQTKI